MFKYKRYQLPKVFNAMVSFKSVEMGTEQNRSIRSDIPFPTVNKLYLYSILHVCRLVPTCCKVCLSVVKMQITDTEILKN